MEGNRSKCELKLSGEAYNAAMKFRNYIRLSIGAVLLFGCVASAQRTMQAPPSQLPQTQIPPQQQQPGGGDSTLQHMQDQAAKARNVERQKLIVQETQQLLKLANELNEAVGKSNENTLSLDVIRKADEIEKLAKHVKDKMKGDY